jgi:hypothetical protein
LHSLYRFRIAVAGFLFILADYPSAVLEYKIKVHFLISDNNRETVMFQGGQFFCRRLKGVPGPGRVGIGLAGGIKDGLIVPQRDRIQILGNRPLSAVNGIEPRQVIGKFGKIRDRALNLTHKILCNSRRGGGKAGKNACRVRLRYLQYASAGNSKYFSQPFPLSCVPTQEKWVKFSLKGGNDTRDNKFTA